MGHPQKPSPPSTNTFLFAPAIILMLTPAAAWSLVARREVMPGEERRGEGVVERREEERRERGDETMGRKASAALTNSAAPKRILVSISLF